MFLRVSGGRVAPKTRHFWPFLRGSDLNTPPQSHLVLFGKKVYNQTTLGEYVMPEKQVAQAPESFRPTPTPEAVEAGLRAFFRIIDVWGINNQQAGILLGHPARATFYNWKKGNVGTVSHDTVQRISYILGIYKALGILYSDPAMADGWIKKPNARFAGKSALDRMLAGDVADLAAVREHLDAVRGGWG